ncbi:hypothetical protein Tco_0761457, partial [Tanacetum coccineum]
SSIENTFGTCGRADAFLKGENYAKRCSSNALAELSMVPVVLSSDGPTVLSSNGLVERISKKRTKNKAKTTKSDIEWKSVEKTKSRQSPSVKKSTPTNPKIVVEMIMMENIAFVMENIAVEYLLDLRNFVSRIVVGVDDTQVVVDKLDRVSFALHTKDTVARKHLSFVTTR